LTLRETGKEADYLLLSLLRNLTGTRNRIKSSTDKRLSDEYSERCQALQHSRTP